MLSSELALKAKTWRAPLISSRLIGGIQYKIKTNDILRGFSTNITHFTTGISACEIMFLKNWYHRCMKYLSVVRCWLRGDKTCRHISTEVEVLVTCVSQTPELEFHGSRCHFGLCRWLMWCNKTELVVEMAPNLLKLGECGAVKCGPASSSAIFLGQTPN